MRHFLTVFTILVCVLTTRSATAQFLAGDDRPEFISLSTSTTSAVAVGVIMLTVVNVRKDPTAMNLYLRENEPAVRAALAIGGGAVIDDLAAFFEITAEQRVAFAAVLRRHRAALCDAAFEGREPNAFASLVQTALLSDRMR